MTGTALSVRDLVVSYDGAAPAVTGYSVDLVPGTLTVILGRNAAGKTSTLRGITGTQVKRPSPLRMSRLGVGLVSERNKIFANLGVQDQLRLVTSRKPDLDEIYGFFPRLSERRSVRAGLLSGGERQMLATALLLLRKPRVLLVDELSLGLAPGMVRELMGYLRRLADEREVTILAVDQAVHASLRVADVVQIMDGGVVVASGPLADLDVESILDTYLGRNER